jgi:D-alanyl-D-alanine carboxypeptidase (penicillin-binding protein 5/6)
LFCHRARASENACANESQKLLNWGTAYEVVTVRRGPGRGVAVGLRATPTVTGRPEAIVVANAAQREAQTLVVRPDPVAPFVKGPDSAPEGHMLGDNPAPVAEVPLMALDAAWKRPGFWACLGPIRLWIQY